jgi:hypothetical protein
MDDDREVDLHLKSEQVQPQSNGVSARALSGGLYNHAVRLRQVAEVDGTSVKGDFWIILHATADRTLNEAVRRVGFTSNLDLGFRRTLFAAAVKVESIDELFVPRCSFRRWRPIDRVRTWWCK